MSTQIKPLQAKSHTSYRNIGILILGILLIYGVLPQIGGFRHSLALLKHAHIGWLVVAIAASCLSYFAAALVYSCLAQKRLRYRQTLLVQIASMFTNRLLPAGIGALGTNYQYLRKRKHTSAQAITVVSVNNLLGFVGNMLLLLIMLLIRPSSLQNLHFPHVNERVVIVIGLVVIIVAALLLYISAKKIIKLLAQIISAFGQYRKRPSKLGGALLGSIILTLSYTGCLYAACRAVGIDLSVTSVLVCMTVGVAGGTAVPTPGGLGGTEAGLVVGLSAFGVVDSKALAAVLLYRLCTYWLALVIGGIAFAIISRKRYI